MLPTFPREFLRRSGALALAAALSACSHLDVDDEAGFLPPPHADAALDAGDTTNDRDTSGDIADSGIELDGAEFDVSNDTNDEPPPPAEGVVPGSASGVLSDYERLCSSCHGTMGQGAIAPRLAGTSRDRATLVAAIADRMPPNDPALCDQACAERMADAILGWIDPDAGAGCGMLVAPAPRAMRLLTRRELRNTLRDLFSSDDDCAPTVFRYRSEPSVRSVHIAGSFNAWPATIAGGGWPMERSGDTWTLSREIPTGRHLYKFVLDETTWISDPTAAESESDGFGGANSVLRVACDAPVDVAALDAVLARVERLPLESRPLLFHFETHAQSGAVTSSSLEDLLDISQQAADLVTPALVLELADCDINTGGAACRELFVSQFASRAFRRPATSAQVARLDALAASYDDVTDGIRAAADAVLASPHFLYRMELGVDRGDGTWELDAWEFASALSYALAGTAPDAALLEAAASGALDSADGVEFHARRLLATTAARDTIEAFAEQWLGTERVTSLVRSATLFPRFDDALREAMRDETRRFVSHVVFDGGGTFDELLTANYSMLNESLATVYGVTGVEGEELRRVSLDASRRSGFLTHPALLASTAHSDQTSPIRRGLFIRQRMLCQDFPPPPPEAGGVPEVDPTSSTRDRFAQHTADAVCAGCHQYIDSLGFGFEHYDPIGAWRDREPNGAIDATASLTDIDGFGSGTEQHFDTIPMLAQFLAESATARACFVREYRRFVVGDAESPDDACGVFGLDAEFLRAELSIQDLMVAVVKDPGFRRRR